MCENLMKKDIDFSDMNAIGSFALGLKESETEKKSGKSDQTKEDEKCLYNALQCLGGMV